MIVAFNSDRSHSQRGKAEILKQKLARRQGDAEISEDELTVQMTRKQNYFQKTGLGTLSMVKGPGAKYRGEEIY